MEYVKALKRYFSESQFDSISFWLLPLGSILLLYVMALLFLMRKRDGITTHEFNIRRAISFASAITAAFVGGFALYYWGTGKFREQPLQFSHLLAFSLPLITGIISIITLANKFSQDSFLSISKQPQTLIAKSDMTQALRQSFNTTKLFTLGLPLVGLLSLAFIQTNSKKMLCFVIDNSSSMGEPMESGMVPLQAGKDALNSTISRTGEYIDITLTYFNDQKTKSTSGQLTAISSSSSASGTSLFYENDKKDAVNDINRISVCNNGSPISEAIWKTYLFAKEQSVNKTYESIYLLVITDGEESNGLSDLSGTMCDQTGFAELFPAENVNFMKLEEANEKSASSVNTLLGLDVFWNKVTDCGYSVLDGTTLTAYNEAFNSIVSEVKNDFIFPFWLGFLFFIYVVIVFLLQPKKSI